MRRQKPFSIYLDAETLARVTAIAESEGRTVYRQMTRWIQRGIRRHAERQMDLARRRILTNGRDNHKG